MNYFFISIISLFTALLSIIAIPYNELEDAFLKGDGAKITSYVEKKVLISINGEEGIYSNTQATQVLNTFFKNNPPDNFKFTYLGKEDGASSFAIGELETQEGNFRISMKFKRGKEKHNLESLKIEDTP